MHSIFQEMHVRKTKSTESNEGFRGLQCRQERLNFNKQTVKHGAIGETQIIIVLFHWH